MYPSDVPLEGPAIEPSGHVVRQYTHVSFDPDLSEVADP